MNSRWVKAILVVTLIWVVIVGGRAILLNTGLQLLPRFIGLGDTGERAERQDNETLSATGLQSVFVQSRNGAVTITGNDGNEIIVTMKYLAKAGSQPAADEKLAKMQTTTGVVNGQLQIKADFGTTSISNQQISYDLSVPRNLLVRAETSNGAVGAFNMSGRLELSTSNGDINITSPQGPKEVQATTSNGTIHVSGNPTNGVYALQSSNGDVQVDLPATLGVELDASTQNGSLDVGAGQWNISGGKLSGKQVTATRGDGALKLTMKTSNGSVILKTK